MLTQTNFDIRIFSAEISSKSRKGLIICTIMLSSLTWFVMTSQIPSHAKMMNSHSSVNSLTSTSGLAENENVRCQQVKQIHCQLPIPCDNCHLCSPGSISESIYGFNRYERCLLVYPNTSKVQEVSSLTKNFKDL